MKRTLIILAIIYHLTFAIDTCLCQNWVQQSVPFTTGYFNDMKFVNENTGFISNSTPLFIKTTNAGYNWQVLNDFTVYSLSIVDSMYMYGAGYRNGYGKLYKSTNCGVTWDSLLQNSPIFSSLYFFNRDTGIICGGDGAWDYIWRTTDGGLTKNLMITINWSSWTKLFFAKEKVNGEYFGLIYNGPQWYKTTNSGLNWQQMPNLPISNIRCIFFLNKDTGWVTVGNTVNYVLYTTNGTRLTQTFPYSTDAIDIYFANPRRGWIASGQNIFATSNGGNNWGTQIIPTGTSSKLFFLDSLTGWSTVFSYNLAHTINGGGPITQIVNNEQTIKDYKLYQNYPNPFNATSNIKYIIPKSSNVRIEVMDILGRNIKTLVNEKQTAGTYQVLFDADNLPSGVYFYTLFADGAIIDAKRLLYLK
ncbi:MAG: T9SS type A sorting domain-containing protein [Ignavibacteria bacterium]